METITQSAVLRSALLCCGVLCCALLRRAAACWVVLHYALLRAGHVNEVGRVNGNLNLSRAIGDQQCVPRLASPCLAVSCRVLSCLVLSCLSLSRLDTMWLILHFLHSSSCCCIIIRRYKADEAIPPSAQVRASTIMMPTSALTQEDDCRVHLRCESLVLLSCPPPR